MFVLLKCRGSVIPKSLLWSVPCALATVLMHLYWGEENLIMLVLVFESLSSFAVAGYGMCTLADVVFHLQQQRMCTFVVLDTLWRWLV